MKELSILGGATESFVMLYDKALLQVDGAGRYDVQASLDGEHWSVLTPITAKCDHHSRTIVLDLLAGAHIRVVCVTGTMEAARYSFDTGEAEAAREAAEAKREQNELLRQANEAERVGAEISREERTAEAIASIANKVDHDDNAPKLTAGFARYLGISSGYPSEEEFSIRAVSTIKNIGVAHISKIVGKSEIIDGKIRGIRPKAIYTTSADLAPIARKKAWYVTEEGSIKYGGEGYVVDKIRIIPGETYKIYNIYGRYAFLDKDLAVLEVSAKYDRGETVIAIAPDNAYYLRACIDGNGTICLQSANPYSPLRPWTSILNISLPTNLNTAKSRYLHGFNRTVSSLLWASGLDAMDWINTLNISSSLLQLAGRDYILWDMAPAAGSRTVSRALDDARLGSRPGTLEFWWAILPGNDASKISTVSIKSETTTLFSIATEGYSKESIIYDRDDAVIGTFTHNGRNEAFQPVRIKLDLTDTDTKLSVFSASGLAYITEKAIGPAISLNFFRIEAVFNRAYTQMAFSEITYHVPNTEYLCDEFTQDYVLCRISVRGYQVGDEYDKTVLTDGVTTLYAIANPYFYYRYDSTGDEFDSWKDCALVWDYPIAEGGLEEFIPEIIPDSPYNDVSSFINADIIYKDNP